MLRLIELGDQPEIVPPAEAFTLTADEAPKAPAGYHLTHCPTCGVATFTTIDHPQPRSCFGCRMAQRDAADLDSDIASEITQC